MFNILKMEIEKFKPDLDNFLKRTSSKPNAKMVKKNPFANDADYLEIGYVQAEMDRVFHGLWQWEINKIEHLINGVLVSGTISVYNPIANQWIKRSGVAFKQYQLSKGAKEPTPVNLSAKALERDVPIASAEAFKNAAKTIGNAFGRHLNRKFQFEHTPDNSIINQLLPTKTENNE